MVSIITGDIVRSKKFKNPEIWLTPLKDALTKTGIDKKYWEVFRGDSFQIEIEDNQRAFHIATYIKACVKTVKGLDVRMAIGVGNKAFEGKIITESNGEAFQFSGDTLEELKKEKTNLKIKSRYLFLNEELNLYFKLALITMDNWSVNSAETVKIALENHSVLQTEMAQVLGVSQDAVSKRLKRAHFSEIMELDGMFRKKINLLEEKQLEEK
ncbi:transcriptional regulator [Mariniflexile gromovii]|uniref:Transcriptional regulator n=1 Tax=Mariniflexile gromovii TaxID=362523 RepID=A0ABS4BRY3_9FLAO|nr:transcriptional regulator [Mariniflexile gromovii]MBP0903292.1 transcriptional regulator [Mariniflexile gromovii]